MEMVLFLFSGGSGKNRDLYGYWVVELRFEVRFGVFDYYVLLRVGIVGGGFFSFY